MGRLGEWFRKTRESQFSVKMRLMGLREVSDIEAVSARYLANRRKTSLEDTLRVLEHENTIILEMPRLLREAVAVLHKKKSGKLPRKTVLEMLEEIDEKARMFSKIVKIEMTGEEDEKERKS